MTWFAIWRSVSPFNIPEGLRATASNIPWSDVIKMGNLVKHHYARLAPPVI